MHNGERIRKARRERGLTQDALAKMIGCSVFSIINWEKGGKPLGVFAEKLEAVLGISLEEGPRKRK